MRALAAAIVALVMIGGWALFIDTTDSTTAAATDQVHTAPTPLAFPAGIGLMGIYIALRRHRRPTSLT